MAVLESITRGAVVKGILPNSLAVIIDVRWIGTVAIEVTYKDSNGRLGNELLYHDREPTLEIVEAGRPWSFDGDSALFRLLSEANRIRLAYLFDPLLAVHTSLVEPPSPVLLGGAIIITLGLLRKSMAYPPDAPTAYPLDAEETERRAMQAVLDTERKLGFIPRDVSDPNLGYDVESAVPDSGPLRFLKVKDLVPGGTTVTLTRSALVTSLNKPEQFILALAILDPHNDTVRYTRLPFAWAPDGPTDSVHVNMAAFLPLAYDPARRARPSRPLRPSKAPFAQCPLLTSQRPL